jgi:hypothetical protein
MCRRSKAACWTVRPLSRRELTRCDVGQARRAMEPGHCRRRHEGEQANQRPRATLIQNGVLTWAWLISVRCAVAAGSPNLLKGGTKFVTTPPIFTRSCQEVCK